MLRLALTALLSIAFGFVLAGLASRDAPVGDDLEARALAALQIAGRNERSQALLDVIDAMNTQNAGEVANALAADTVVVSECEVKPFVRATADLSFDAALPIVQQWEADNLNRWGLEESARGLVLAGKLDEARKFARSRRSTARRDAFVTGLVAGWADTGDLHSIAAYIAAMPDGGRRNVVIDPLARALIRRLGLQGAMDWAAGLPDDANPAGVARGTFLPGQLAQQGDC